MAQFKQWFTQDLTESIVVRHCESVMFTGDDQGAIVGVRLYENGTPYSGGGAVTGAVKRLDGGRVMLTGTLSGNAASVVIPAAALTYAGPIGVQIILTVGNQKTTVLKAVYSVDDTSGTPVDPGDLIPDIDELLAEIENMRTATAAANTAATNANTAAQNGVRTDTASQGLNTTQQGNARTNIDAASGEDFANIKSRLNTLPGMYRAGQLTNIDYLEHTAYLLSNGTFGTDLNCHCLYTPKIPCSPGDTFAYKGYGKFNAVSCVFYLNDTVVSSVQIDSRTGYSQIAVPSGVNFAVFSSFEAVSNPIVLDVLILNSNIIPAGKADFYDRVNGLTAKNLDSADVVSSIYKSGSYSTPSGTVTTLSGYYVSSTAFVAHNLFSVKMIPVSPGEIYEVCAVTYWQLVPYAFLDSYNNVVSAPSVTESSAKLHQSILRAIVPKGAVKMAYNEYAADGIAATVRKVGNIETAIDEQTNIITAETKETDTQISILQGKYLSYTNGNLIDNVETGYYTAFIPVSALGTVYVTASAKQATALCVLYDSSMRYIASVDKTAYASVITWTDRMVSEQFIRDGWPNAAYVVFGSYIDPLIIKRGTRKSIAEYVGQGGNPLKGKVWYAIGDSATHGDFSSIAQPKFSDGMYAGELMVYPFYIGNRTGMIVHNLAVNGAIMTTMQGKANYQWSVDGHYDLVQSDADYITIWIGANDMWQSAPIGTIDDTSPETFYGAYNKVLTYYINHFPNAKIGLVASFWCTSNYALPVVALGAKYGIPVLNFYNDPTVPVSVGSQRPDVSAAVKDLRNSQWVVSGTNGHPSAKYHEIESYFIESWLKTL